jgi:hypothetical protein
MPDGSLF